MDQPSTYKAIQPLSLQAQLQGLQRAPSQFERALRELGVEVIHAYSPAAKGRIERLFGIFQDRLLKEMRLQGIKSQHQANTFLQHYLPQPNRRFRVQPAQAANLHRPLPPGLDLNSILCLKTQRCLNSDSTLAHGGKLYLITDPVKAALLTVEERIDGSLRITHQHRRLHYREILRRPRRAPAVTRSFSKTHKVKPAADHPWRRPSPRSKFHAHSPPPPLIVSRPDLPHSQKSIPAQKLCQ